MRRRDPEWGVFSRAATSCEATMNQESLRFLIRHKIQVGRLPHDSTGRVWTSTRDGQETCDAYDTIFSMEQLLMERTTLMLGGQPIHFRARCFQVWDEEISAE
ncbi:MAG: hypothetical protein DMD87_13540 [Candidatus Rokuibacteriota bacterium]|nr:MAG: hypothetical protein DMD87_13540 [Candidatus Rokubacteria bacterium]